MKDSRLPLTSWLLASLSEKSATWYEVPEGLVNLQNEGIMYQAVHVRVVLAQEM
jgi:hypothetical protein